MQASYVEVRNILKNLHFPLTKQNLIQQAMKHGASHKVIKALESIPDREYTSYENVVQEFICKQLYLE
jgi:hypothetical protein